MLCPEYRNIGMSAAGMNNFQNICDYINMIFHRFSQDENNHAMKELTFGESNSGWRYSLMLNTWFSCMLQCIFVKSHRQKSTVCQLFSCPSSSMPTFVINWLLNWWSWIQLQDFDQTKTDHTNYIPNLLSWPTWTTSHLTYPPTWPTHSSVLPTHLMKTHPPGKPPRTQR